MLESKRPMASLVVFGATGFVGRNLIQDSSRIPIKAVTRNIPPDRDFSGKGVAWFTADLLDPQSLDGIVVPGDVLINLAYVSSASETENFRLMDNIIEAGIRGKASRLVHCSTAVVAGATKSSRIVETTPCLPVTSYERIKLALEQRALNCLSSGLDVGILRPTAIIGQGGQNLLKLARALQSGKEMTNYLRACLFGRRSMHLVSVRDVTAALLHLAVLPTALNGNIYIVSADDDPENNFQSVETRLIHSLSLAPRKLPLLPVPSQVLSVLLALRGRSETNVKRIYDSRKLRDTNFRSVESVAAAIRGFAEGLQNADSEGSLLNALHAGKK